MDDIPIIVRDVAVVVCDEPSIMEEALTKVSLEGIEFQRLGPRAIATRSTEATELVNRFYAAGIYPRVIGETIDEEE